MSAKSFFLISYTRNNLDDESFQVNPLNPQEILNTDFSLPLHDKSDECAGVKVTIIIGPNGSGKSTVVASLAEELKVMAEILGRTNQDSLRKRAAQTTRATIKYRSGSDVVKLTRVGAELMAEVDGRRCDLRSVPFPSNVLAVAHLPTDKFRFSRHQKHDSFYRYLGLRQATNLTTTGSLESAVIASLLTSRSSSMHQAALKDWLSYVGIEDEFFIEVTLIDENVLTAHDMQGLLALAHNTPSSKFLNDPKEIFSDAASSLDLEKIDRGIEHFLKQLHDKAILTPSTTGRMRPSLLIPIRALSPPIPGEPVSLQIGFDLLRKLRLTRSINLIVNKKGRTTTFMQLSSGERQILGTATRLIEHAVNGSVILIDEPEISLHPTWQIAYLPRLLKALNHLQAAHVIIATHSHFMVSDIDEAASLTVASQDSDLSHRQFVRFEEDVYGRTPENILYRVFGIGTTSNFYVEQDLAVALQMISGTTPVNKAKLYTIRAQLEKVRGSDNPAFEEILRLIDQYLEAEQNA